MGVSAILCIFASSNCTKQYEGHENKYNIIVIGVNLKLMN